MTFEFTARKKLHKLLGDHAMRIIQICSAHVGQCGEQTVLGLGEDGAVYMYREEVKPSQTQEQVMVPASELTVEQMLNAQPVNNTPPAMGIKPEPEQETRGIFRSKPTKIKTVDEETKQDPNGRRIDPSITHYIIWREIFRDGWTAGWYPLSMNVSKAVPHKNDPTRSERA